MSDIKFDDDVPLPPAKQEYGFVTRVLREMPVGKSYLFQNVSSVSNIHAAKNRLVPKKFTSERQGRHLRVWRIS